MSRWQIESEEYLNRLGFDRECFEKELKLPQIEELRKIIPLREIKKIHSIIPIPLDLVRYLIKKIPTLDGQLPFRNSRIEPMIGNPPQLKIGQKYVYRENYQNLLENMSSLFDDIFGAWGRFGKLGAYFVFGFNGDGNYSMACYLPPMIEIHRSRSHIMDGIHRNFIGLKTGITIDSLRITDIEVPFPCSPRNWDEIVVIPLNEKPKELEDRYFDLKKHLFRDLKYLGIDG